MIRNCRVRFIRKTSYQKLPILTILLINVLLLSGLQNVFSQDSIAIKYASTIQESDLKKHLNILASDEYEGRETGKKGQKLAEKYLVKQFKSYGLPPVVDNNSSFLQVFELREEKWGDLNLTIAGKNYQHLKDFYAFGRYNTISDLEQDKIIFLGYGIESDNYNDYENADVKGKVIMIFSGEPVDKKGNSLITGSKQLSSWSTNMRKKITHSLEKNVKAVIIVDEEFESHITTFSKYITHPSVRLASDKEKQQEETFGYAYISPEVAKDIFEGKKKSMEKIRKKISKKKEPFNTTIDKKIRFDFNRISTPLLGSNVLGYVEGTDLKDELVVITAHYDHIGKEDSLIFNGADDDASGTVTVLEIAEAFAKAKREGNGPRRSILCMPVSGEEKGLLGSSYYSDNPVFPIDKTVANLNIDMIGRIDEKHKDKPNYVYIIGSNMLSTELHKINEEANETYTNIYLDYAYNKKDDPNRFYYRSDHYNFAKHNIPVIFYFNGTHEDYHQHTDTVEKINYNILEKRGKLIFHTAWKLANRDKRIVVDVKEQ